MSDQSPPTTEFAIAANDQVVVDLLHQQYGRLESGEARTALENKYGQVWNEAEFAALFEVTSLEPPYAHVVSRETGRHGTIMFLDSPRFYFLLHLDTESDHV